jgi:hypothetical protein
MAQRLENDDEDETIIGELCCSGGGPRSTLKIVLLNMPKFITTPEMFR